MAKRTSKATNQRPTVAHMPATKQAPAPKAQTAVKEAPKAAPPVNLESIRKAERQQKGYAPSLVPPDNVVRGTVEAPRKVDIHAPAPEAAQTAKRLTKEALKASGVDKADTEAVKAKALLRLLADGPKGYTADTLDAAFSSSQLQEYLKAKGLTGYSSLKKGELVAYVLQGTRPGATKDSARDVAEKLKALKASGKVTGPVSALSMAAGKAVLEQVAKEGKAEVKKPEPKDGSVDALRLELAKHDRKAVNAWLKEAYGRSFSSATKAHVQAALARFAPAKKAA